MIHIIIVVIILYPTLEQIILKEQTLAVNDDDDVKQMLEKEHVKKFKVEDNSIPLWRIIVGIMRTSSVLIKEEESNKWNLIISIVRHHSIGEGRSALVSYSSFNEYLLEILSKNNFNKNFITNQNLKLRFHYNL
ncbi:hypothetical protein RCL_jg29448.t1 [Rhizophagus clarus]|uniref:Uncharacterized protein n=1 Tax=Rhizophagus clarus TaxID=94130 RepID=A0A8H3L292_9GLOM|nr:hypothetical protein RCL_jg29448.t1 [Rhizophagus clarus]